jgi:hypothetical protein
MVVSFIPTLTDDGVYIDTKHEIKETGEIGYGFGVEPISLEMYRQLRDSLANTEDWPEF